MTASQHGSGEEVGFEVMDREHRVQIDLLDTLHDAVQQGRPAEQVVEIVDRLLDYSRAHFLSEQLLMRLHAYPDFQAHRDEHDRMVDVLQAMREDTVGSGSALDAIERLRIDLVGHIAREDAALSLYLKSSGIGG